MADNAKYIEIRQRTNAIYEKYALAIAETEEEEVFLDLEHAIENAVACCDKCGDLAFRTVKGYDCRGCGKQVSGPHFERWEVGDEFFFNLLVFKGFVEDIRELKTLLPSLLEEWKAIGRESPVAILKITTAVELLPKLEERLIWVKTGS